MNNRSVFRTLAIAVLLIAGAVAIGMWAYNAGVAQGVAESGRALAVPPSGAPVVYVWPRPWGFGFFPIFPIFFFLLFFFLLRGLFWGGPWRRGVGCGYGYDAVPPAFEEWHRRAHGSVPAPPAGNDTR